MTRPAAGQLRLFGTPHWSEVGGMRRDVPDSLPGYLLVHLAFRSDWLAREELAGLFWPDRAEVEAQHNLRANLHRVRSLLSEWGVADALLAERRRVRIELPTDVAAFQAAVARADWRAAAELHGEPLLSALTFRGFAAVDDWARERRRTLSDAWVEATLRAALALERDDDAAGAAALLLRLAQGETATEEAMQSLLRVAAAAGRRDEALAALERYRLRLRDELGLQPVPATLALAETLRSSAAGTSASAKPRRATATSDGGAALRVQLLGPPQLLGAQPLPFAPERRFHLLAMLALASGDWVPRDRVAALLWPDHALADARRNLRHVVFKARGLPGAEDLEATDHALRWNVPTDLLALRRAVQAGRPGDALSTRRGTPLAGLDDPANPALREWLATERARIEALWHQAAHDRLQQLDEPAQRRDLAQQMLQADPLDELAMSEALKAELALGQRARAEDLYRVYASRLADELGVEPSHTLRDLLTQAARPPPAQGAAPVSAPGSAFIGRRAELAELGLLLARPDCRLVTVLGPGGIGKSSLARRALDAGVAGFAGGTYWVEMQDLADVAAVTARLSQQLGVDLKEGKDPVEQLGARLAGERLLIVLDNAEHLAGLPALIERLLAAGAALTLLVTSRVRMFGEHEWLLPLDGLAVPDSESRDLEAAQAFDGVRLFALRATAAQRSFSLARHLDAVIEIVDAVAGMPLAIELAAAWVRLLPPVEIAAELRQSLELLEREPGTAGQLARPEHASIRTVLERSWQLLGPREREAMRALSVFRGGFTRSAARAVADAPLALLSSLVDKSYLKVDDDGRFTMHPLVVADISARATAEDGRVAERRRRHAEYYALTLADLGARHPIQHRPIVGYLDKEFANAQQAWDYAVASSSSDLLRSMVGCWKRYYVVTGRVEEGSRWLSGVLPVIEGAEASQSSAELLAALAWLCFAALDTDRGLALASRAHGQAQALGDRRLEAECVMTIGACRVSQARWSEAGNCFEQSLRIAEDLGLRRETASALNNLGIVSVRLGRYDEALDLYARSLAIQTELEDHLSVSRLLHNVAAIHMSRGDWTQARLSNERALSYSLEHGIATLVISVEFMLGATLIELGELDAAEKTLNSARVRARTAQSDSYQLKTDYYLARVLARRGDRSEAARRLLSCARTARLRGWDYDLLYMSVFIGEVLRDEGKSPVAERLLRSVLGSRLVDAAVTTLAECCLRSLPTEASRRDSSLTGPGVDVVPSFEAIAARFADVGDLAEFATVVSTASA